MRFFGATFDISGLMRFNAVQSWLSDEAIEVADIHHRVMTLQQQFLAELSDAGIALGELLPGRDTEDRGHFLTFRSDKAQSMHRMLAELDVTTDVRADRLRFGFGLYHDASDVDELVRRIRKAGLRSN
jgi:selenocysteine lyase/cysteine desulfurase